MIINLVKFDYTRKVIIVNIDLSEKEIWDKIIDEFYKPENMNQKMPAVFFNGKIYMINDWSMIEWRSKELR